MNMTRREWITAAALVAVSARRTWADESGIVAPIAITVYKTASCDCCRKWVAHLEQNGFAPTTHDLLDLTDTKTMLGVPVALQSCHTAVAGKYVIEGHVPADVIRKFLAEKPKDLIGLSVPGMVTGSPGMEGDRRDPYSVIAFSADGRRIGYAQRK